jgi:hypothetical protein
MLSLRRERTDDLTLRDPREDRGRRQGEVYLAEELQRKVAVKFLALLLASDPDRKERFLREARAYWRRRAIGKPPGESTSASSSCGRTPTRTSPSFGWRARLFADDLEAAARAV